MSLRRVENLCQIERNRYCFRFNFLVNLMSGIVAYHLFNSQPILNLTRVNNSLAKA